MAFWTYKYKYLGCFVQTLVFLGGTPGTALSDDVVLLDAIRQNMAQKLSRIPNYTCLETVSRGQRAPDRLIVAAHGKEVPFRRFDVLRLEVAQVNGDELLARAGEHVFKKRELSEFAGAGMMGNGLFSGFIQAVFNPDIVVPHLAGAEKIDGRTVWRYDFQVSAALGQWLIRTNSARALVGYHGSFLADPRTLEVVRLDIVADDVPLRTGLTGVSFSVDYTDVRIGASTALLPQNSEMNTANVQGWEHRNQIAFTHCREYGVESVVHFDDVADAAEGSQAIELPAGLQMTVSLETPIDSDTARAGDPIRGRLILDAKQKGVVVVPKDAAVSGRIRSVERHTESSPLYVAFELEFTQIEFEGKRARFFAQLDQAQLDQAQLDQAQLGRKDLLPGVGKVSAKGRRLVLPTGMHTIWKTLSY